MRDLLERLDAAAAASVEFELERAAAIVNRLALAVRRLVDPEPRVVLWAARFRHGAILDYQAGSERDRRRARRQVVEFRVFAKYAAWAQGVADNMARLGVSAREALDNLARTSRAIDQQRKHPR